jgi:ribosomal protein S27E
MEPLDGNAIAGELFVHFGREMTTERGRCGHCGARGQIAELVVYACAPSPVVRCPSCGNVVIVISHATIHLDHFELSEGTIASS